MSDDALSRELTDLLRESVGSQVSVLQNGYLKDLSSQVAALAQLRRGAGKAPQDVPELWGMTGTERLFSAGELRNRDAGRAEAAMFLAVTLYALHQQSKADPMHRPGIELGTAVRRLMTATGDDESVRQRFVRVGLAATPDVLAYRLRELVSLLRRHSVPLDYALLAERLYQAQLPGRMSEVRQKWGLSFHRSAAQREDSSPTTDKDA